MDEPDPAPPASPRVGPWWYVDQDHVRHCVPVVLVLEIGLDGTVRLTWEACFHLTY